MEALEVLFVFGILILVFGPKRLPKMARELGKAVYEFRKYSSGIVSHTVSTTEIENRNAENDAILHIAEKLNVEAEEKNIKQVTEEILTKLEEGV